MDNEEYRTGSADSENGSSDSYVQVTPEDAQPATEGAPIPEAQEFASPIAETTAIPSGPEDEDIYTFGEKEEPADFPEPVQVTKKIKITFAHNDYLYHFFGKETGSTF